VLITQREPKKYYQAKRWNHKKRKNPVFDGRKQVNLPNVDVIYL
jgi:hypothetical protein